MITYNGDSKILKALVSAVNTIVTDYPDLNNKPKVNNVELVGNKTLSDLGVPTEIDDLSDVDISSATDEQVLKYNETTEKWENGNIDIPTNLSDLTNDCEYLSRDEIIELIQSMITPSV